MIRENIDKFISSIRSVENIVLCVGAGVSVSSGLPSYLALVKAILSFLQPTDNALKQELNNIDYQNLPLIMDYITQEYGKKRVEDVIRKIYSDSVVQPSELLDSIAKFPAKAYITTNLDVLLESRLKYFHKNYEVYTDDIDIFHRETIPVIKLNGSIDKDFYATNYSKSSRFNLAASPQLYSEFLSLLQSSVLMFVGFSLSSLEAFYELYSMNTSPDWFFLNLNNVNNLERRIWEKRGINILNFESYNDVPLFLNSLTDLINSKHKEPSRRKNNKIFISSPIENSDIANIFRNKLENTGFAVFTVRESSSAGLTIFEKIDKVLSEVGTAIILFPDKVSNRSLENFMFEVGYITAKLGRNNVIVLVPKNVDKLPSEISGSIYITYDISDLDTNRIVHLVTKKFNR